MIPNDPMDHMWQMHMKTLTHRKKMMEISETIDRTLWEWYSERELQVPNWKNKKDPDWWIEYLEELKNNDL